jgi:hypothetical protein
VHSRSRPGEEQPHLSLPKSQYGGA